MLGLTETQLAALAGFGGGMLLGLAARIGRYCMMGAVEDAVYGADLGRMRMLAMSAAVAIAGTFTLVSLGILVPDETRYFRTVWSPAGSVAGGLLFGYGMALVGTCGFGALARAGGGDLRSLMLAIVIGIGAYLAIAGPLTAVRLWLSPVTPTLHGAQQHGLAHIAGQALSVPPILPALLAAAGLAGWALIDARFRRPGRHLGWSLVVGLAVVLGWFATARLADVSLGEVETESFSFAAPLGQSLIYAMTSTVSRVDFTIGAVGGVIAGAAVGSLAMGEFRWEACDDARELRRQILGATLMGVGGVIAVGCTIGQGLSALSLMSASAPVTILAILAGARAGLYVLVEAAAFSR